eukprot:145291_1
MDTTKKDITHKKKHGPFCLNKRAYQLFNTDFWQSDRSRHLTPNNSQNKGKYPLILSGNTIMKCVHHKPNMFVINNFLTDREVNHILNISRTNVKRFELSYTQSTKSSLFHRIYSPHRTSTCIFLQRSMDRIVSRIEQRAANIVGVPKKKVEQIQIVRYTNGQQFRLHHDAGTLSIHHPQRNMDEEYAVDLLLPLRVYSFFVYLTSLEAGEGGETYFTKLGLKIRPQRGTAVLWCNVDVDNVFKG